MPLSIRSKRGPHGVSVGRIRTRAQRMLDALNRSEAELSVMLVDDPTIQELNRDYRSIDKPTDVLSFSMNEGEFAGINPDLLGDVIISVPTARRQAEESQRTVLDEVTFLLAHGLLHLMGYDHQTEKEFKVMDAETKRLMQIALGTSSD